MASLVAPKTQRNVQALARAGTAVVLKEGQRTESRGGDSLDHGVHIAGSVCVRGVLLVVGWWWCTEVTIAVASAVQLGSSIKSVIVLDLNRNSMRTALQ